MHGKQVFAVLLALGIANGNVTAAAPTALAAPHGPAGGASAIQQRGNVVDMTGTVVSVPSHRYCATISPRLRTVWNCAQVKAGLTTLWLIWVAEKRVNFFVGQRLAIRATITGQANGAPVSSRFTTRSLTPKGDPFAVSIVIDQQSLHTAFYRRIARFYIDATVRNVSRTDQTITVWTNFGWSWLSDAAEVGPSTEATQNFPTKIVLAPGQAYKGRIETATLGPLEGPVTFRFGFVPNVSAPASGMTHPPTNVTWSSQATLRAARGSQARYGAARPVQPFAR